MTGGASGLGEATVRRLVGAGAAVTIVDRDVDKGEALAKELGDATRFAVADVADPGQVEAAVDMAAAQGPLRIAVNCAGVGWASRVVARDGAPHDFDAFMFVVRVNLIGTFNALRLAAAAMSKTDPVDDDGQRGVIVNTASIAAFDGQIGQISYSASKGGRRHDSPGHVPDPRLRPDGRSARSVLGPASTASQAHGAVPRVCGPGPAHLRERLPQRRGHPPRRRPAHAAEVDG